MSGFRADGLNNPLSINSGLGCTWSAVENACEESEAVVSYSRDGGSITIVWCDKSEDEYTDPQAALIAIREME